MHWKHNNTATCIKTSVSNLEHVYFVAATSVKVGGRNFWEGYSNQRNERFT